MRTERTIITLMTRLEPYIPSLNRSGGDHRYAVGLLLHDVVSGKRGYIELARGRTAGELSSARLASVSGTTLWAQVSEEVRVDVTTGRVHSHNDLTRATHRWPLLRERAQWTNWPGAIGSCSLTSPLAESSPAIDG
ncbi:MAG: hypothetical protein ABIT38_22435 [Gemmatimonadaceae bacterium]